MPAKATANSPEWWEVEIEGKPDFETCMRRIYAWYEGEIIDRPPVRFLTPNPYAERANASYPAADLKARWFDEHFQVETFLKSIQGQVFLGETFPIFWPNLGPEVYAAFYGSELTYGEATAWSQPVVRQWQDLARLKLDMNNAYFRKIESLTRHALERCEGKFMVGYTDLHPGVDCAAAWRDPQNLCIDMIENPDQVKALIGIASKDFHTIFNHFDAQLKAQRQLSATWMGIPSFGKLHVPSCDFSAMISNQFFAEFCLPAIEKEVKTMTHNIFHMDGKGVARQRHLILDMPEIHAIQWVQGAGAGQPILQWVPLIREMQRKKPVIVDLQKHELAAFMEQVRPERLFLWISVDNDAEEQQAILKRIEKWN